MTKYPKVSEKKLHIISFDVPYPADYGGVIDVFYTLKEMKEQGISVVLHCFKYGREKQESLEQYCDEVHYYARSTGHKGVSTHLPYIVSSRVDERLFTRLLEDEYPILAQGIHCTYLLLDDRFKNRKIFTRLMNVEHLYYRALSKTSSSPLKKLYYHFESRLLKKYEGRIADKTFFIALSEDDLRFYKKEFHASRIRYIPCIHPYDEIQSQEGIGCYCLYHGNLSVPENEKAAIWLIEEVFQDLKVPVLIAGKNPSPKLQRIAESNSHVCLVPDPTDQEMQDMIRKAQINVIPSFNATGLKLKLLNAVYNGRHCVLNKAGVAGTGLDAACHIAGNAEGFKSIITQLYHRPFAEEEIILRKKLVQGIFDSRKNTAQMIQLIFS